MNLKLEKIQLKIPHISMTERDFVLLPLKEICPHWSHPSTKEKYDNCFALTAYLLTYLLACAYMLDTLICFNVVRYDCVFTCLRDYIFTCDPM